MKQRVSLDDIELIYVADGLVEFPEEMRVARVRPVHRLELEAEIVARRLWIERSLCGYQRLIQKDSVGPVREQMSKIDIRLVGIEHETCFDMAGNLQCAPPRGRGGRCSRWRLQHRQIGGERRRRARNAQSKCQPSKDHSKNPSLRHSTSPQCSTAQEIR